MRILDFVYLSFIALLMTRTVYAYYELKEVWKTLDKLADIIVKSEFLVQSGAGQFDEEQADQVSTTAIELWEKRKGCEMPPAMRDSVRRLVKERMCDVKK